ncbi:MAG: hypothetical protein WEB60_05000 [Terrimicrobiaceae bacterium]
MFFQKLSFLIALVPIVASVLPVSLLHADSPGKWKPIVEGSKRSLSNSFTATLLGQTTPVTVTFRCDPTRDKESSGTLGFEVAVKNPAKIKEFPFESFEGPDAVAAPEVQVTLISKDQPPRTFKAPASGSFSDVAIFTFDVSEVSKKAKSVPRSLLQALAGSDFETLKISIAPPGKPDLALDLTLSVSGKLTDFQSLLTGLK